MPGKITSDKPKTRLCKGTCGKHIEWKKYHPRCQSCWLDFFKQKEMEYAEKHRNILFELNSDEGSDVVKETE